MNDRNLGSFKLNNYWLRQNPKIIAKAFREMKCVPVQIDYIFYTDELLYTAISEKFEEVPLGMIPPEYTISIKLNKKGKFESITILPKDREG